MSEFIGHIRNNGYNMTREEILSMDYIDLVINCESKFGIKKFDIIPDEKSAQFLMFAWKVEEKLKETDKIHPYLKHLSDITNSAYKLFNIVHASPIDRLRAALLTLEGVV